MDTLLHYIFFLLQPTTCFETDRTPLLVLLEAIDEVMLSDDSAHFVFFVSSVIIGDGVSGAIWEKARAELVSKQSQRRVKILK